MHIYSTKNIPPNLMFGEYPIFSALRVIIHSFDLFSLFHFKKVDYTLVRDFFRGIATS